MEQEVKKKKKLNIEWSLNIKDNDAFWNSTAKEVGDFALESNLLDFKMCLLACAWASTCPCGLLYVLCADTLSCVCVTRPFIATAPLKIAPMGQSMNELMGKGAQ